MLRNLCVAASVFSLMGSMPAFASAGVDAGQIQNEVIPMKTMGGTQCPQLDFGHKIVEKALATDKISENFTASINSIIWTVRLDNKGALDGIGRDKTGKEVTMLSNRQARECRYQVKRDGSRIELTMSIKPSVDEISRKAEHIKMVRGIVEKIKAAGVVSYDDLMNIINEVMPKPR